MLVYTGDNITDHAQKLTRDRKCTILRKYYLLDNEYLYLTLIYYNYILFSLLAYELANETSKTNYEPGRGIPVKKIFIENDSIIIDDKNIDMYGCSDTPNPIIQSLQENLDMPLDTNFRLNLPKKIVASNSPQPYVKISGYYKAYHSKKGQLVGELTLGDPKKGYYAKLNLSDLKDEIISTDITLKIDTKNYVQGSQTLYEAYCKNHIIQNNKLSAELFEKIVKKFFEYIKSKDITFINGKTAFLLYILPSSEEITYIDNDNSETATDDLDSFGNPTVAYPKSPTTGVFFMSYDDKAFTINCTEKDQFYQNLGIGKESHKNILLPNNKMINISGFNWYFLNLGKPYKIFQKTSRGIYHQLHHNYKDIMSEKPSTTQLMQMHVICIKKTNAKLEIMINENLLMPKLHELFADVDDPIPRDVLELLIIRRGQSTIFRYYMMAIKSLLNKTPFDTDLLIKIFTDQIRSMYRDWLILKNSKDAKDFFIRSEFCYKTLKPTNKLSRSMKEAEFAKSVGHMAREYVDFRTATNNDNNSLRDILSKQKYDLETLKFVIKTIGRGIHLLNISSDQYKTILSKISNVAPPTDIDDSNRKDFAYYFYMGYFGDNKK